MQGVLLLPENGNCWLLQHNCVNRVPNARRQRTAPFCSTGAKSRCISAALQRCPCVCEDTLGRPYHCVAGVHNNGTFAVRQKHVAPRCRLQARAVATLEGVLCVGTVLSTALLVSHRSARLDYSSLSAQASSKSPQTQMY